MTHHDDTDGLDAELRSLIEAERRRPGPPPGTASRVQAAVLATVAATAASTAAASTAVTTAAAATTATTSALSGGTLGTGAIIAAALAATVAGTVFIASADVEPSAPAVVVVDAPAPTPPPGLVVAPEAPVPGPPETPTTTPPADRPTTSTGPTKPVVVEATPAEGAARLAAEREVLGAARQALAAGDVDGALQQVQRHRETFARGHLVEEREALQVLALARGGASRRREASDAADRFRTTWPRSLFLEAINRALR